MNTNIELDAVSKRFGKKPALRSISFSAGIGITIVLGANGAGKSTLLRCIDGLYRPDSGSVSVMGLDPYKDQQLKSRLALLADSYGLYDFLSVTDNIIFFGRLYGMSKEESLSSAKPFLEEFDAVKYLNYKVGELSRGTKQKIAFCRSVMNDPEVLLLDEPTAFLDTKASGSIRDYIIRNSRKKAVILVTQKMDEVTRYNARIMVIREGRLAADLDSERFYRTVLRNTEISVRLAKPISASAARRIRGFAGGNADEPSVVRIRIRNYYDVNSRLKELIGAGAMIVGVDYIEPAIEKLSFRRR